MTEQTRYTEDTMFKVQAAITALGYTGQPVLDIIGSLQNHGILFRERVPDDEAKDNREPEWAESEMATQAEEPIEHRLRRAWLNGYGEGFNRGSWGDNRWDR